MAFIGNTNQTQAFTPAVDYFTGNGSTTAFTLSRPVASVAQVQAVIENVPQNPGTAFTVSGNTVTFSSAPPAPYGGGSNNIYIYYTSPITQVIQPSQGTVGQSQMSSPTGTGNPVLQTSPTLTSPTMSGAVVSAMASSVLTQGTAQPTTSGTSIPFTGIPSWVKRITVILQGVKTSSTSIPLIQLGSGSATTSGYLGVSTVVDGSAPTYGGTNISAGFNITGNSQLSTYLISGNMTLTNISGNIWVCAYVGGTSSTARGFTTAGYISLSGVLDRVILTITNGTDTFTAGSINIQYE